MLLVQVYMIRNIESFNYDRIEQCCAAHFLYSCQQCFSSIILLICLIQT